ncbi:MULTISPECIES: 4-hydroxy-tetrahydrodipicolinate synthase [Bordetella]|uniref:4-hydroxy-tetrahydrodipicolinate synthase n=1 Tax=Bordetella genomosp. 6 TaxID=463024 RepID=A0ABX4F9J7_9BORD|nr:MULTISPECIES: 4-hydroxy-tetrahydrodipicolinate synthase [Bordetella]AOB25691.1 4-hydroxy-tetrahydrodipicolinate synthase [Bordetella bronchiseptica]AZW42952.1 4-hydroxy-tetrahydrodipicolinate synthase [Bordetella bronchiseptica]KCV65898.1 4-hydroxy-tetrahydrodipicolinate synthase [Bordetella bronchiseptica 99-R-0433]MBN3268385.1 4-hydroxy-tetrahydrodipicolinate synthase [Bordetella bronchiseptica]OZI73176.1 4-hydroxy-tetrahydrodipicolinate synthase [Bordetella genomosp. 6]
MIDATSLRGILTALPTPVDAQGAVDARAARLLVEYQLRHGINGLVPIGGTGEYGSLARAERCRMVEATAQAAQGKVPVIAGVLDTGYFDALQSGRELAAAGADALMVVTPYYTNPTQAGLLDYFLRYADESPVPLIIYEIPYRTRIALAPEVLHQLSSHERIIGMKACNTDMYHFLRVVAGVSDTFSVLSGEDTLLPLHLLGGARGGIVVTATMLPAAWLRLFQLATSGRGAEALALHRELMPVMDLAFAETNPGPLKAVWDLIGIEAPALLAPLREAAPELQAALRQCMASMIQRFGQAA